MVQMIRSLSGKVPLLLGILCFTLISIIVFVGDTRKPSAICKTDYVATLYVAGHMVRNGHSAEIYPTIGTHNFRGQPYVNYANKLFKEFGEPGSDFFTYPPIIAVLAALMSLMPPIESLVIWQIISLVCLFIAALIFSQVHGVSASPFHLFFCSFIFLPLLHLFVVGQTSVVLGLLPLVAGYYFWQRGNPYFAGLCWSILGLKPQLIIPIGIILFSTLGSIFKSRHSLNDLDEALKITLGIICGLGILHIAGILILGMHAFTSWLYAVYVYGEMFASRTTAWPGHLFISLPCVLLLCLPKTYPSSIRYASYLLGLLATSIALIASTQIASNSRAASEKRDLLMIIGTVATLFIAPHLLLYDTVILLLPGWIIFHHLTGESYKAAFKPTLITCWSFNLYAIFLMVPALTPGQPNTTIGQVALLIIVCLCTTSFVKRSLSL